MLPRPTKVAAGRGRYCRRLALALGAAAACGLSAGLAEAQHDPGQTWRHLTPDKRMQQREQYFSTLPEPEQQRLRDNQRKFHALPADRKQVLCARFLSQNGYAPPACQDFLGD